MNDKCEAKNSKILWVTSPRLEKVKVVYVIVVYTYVISNIIDA